MPKTESNVAAPPLVPPAPREPVPLDEFPSFDTPAEAAAWLRSRGYRQLGIASSPGCLFARPDRPAQPGVEWKHRTLTWSFHADGRALPVLTQGADGKLVASHQWVITGYAEPLTADQAVKHEHDESVNWARDREKKEREARGLAEASTLEALNEAQSRYFAMRQPH